MSKFLVGGWGFFARILIFQEHFFFNAIKANVILTLEHLDPSLSNKAEIYFALSNFTSSTASLSQIWKHSLFPIFLNIFVNKYNWKYGTLSSANLKFINQFDKKIFISFIRVNNGNSSKVLEKLFIEKQFISIQFPSSHAEAINHNICQEFHLKAMDNLDRF